jgi:hypothetical protein
MSKEEIFRSILSRVSDKTGISESDILGKKRDTPIIEARQLFRSLLFRNSLSKNEIAKQTNCNHVTVGSGIKRFEDLLQTDPKFREKIQLNFSDLLEIKVKKPVYIIGKVTGMPYKDCVNKFKEREAELNRAGYIAVNPMRLVPKNTPWHEAMRICLAAMIQCYGVNPLDDWKDSRGGMLEMHLAQELKMNIMYKF